MEASIPDASYDKSHWFEGGGDSGAASGMQLSDSVALLLADDPASRTAGNGADKKGGRARAADGREL
jgi:hypothetical protein